MMEPDMTSVLTPVLPDAAPHSQPAATNAQIIQKHDTKEYLLDMLKELSAIAAWAELERAQKYIDAALREVEDQDKAA
jgi:hypothetical protein